MARYATVTLTIEDLARIAEGYLVPINTFGGTQRKIRFRSLKNRNKGAYDRHMFELRVGNERVILSASSLIEAISTM